MSAKVTLTITEGKLSGRQYIFDSRTSCILGRASECNIKLPDDDFKTAKAFKQALLNVS
ncbi:MAG: FHA domain-containing protein [Richelia sp. RM2_1_2]|uniref:FHA domain-containing protein n=1 Tax=Plectonema cf. radiosum LEGE 06105 TaxID=945769 RepID=A0A8J7F1J8_9CYAN|nr:FHA domain-containing protein [Plectonema radiosum]NJM23073.1 FHA domain-containing protein [Richelia sp. SM1_7_0]NJN11159.1 FHA domain-containing protein [Richelia sp. RM1_1_1]NJO29670.1 FHA domain-containing protein [Richelia sp. SL_2_1]NJO57909.1 FHA domain-containing protein [Richelia sp. RM2_1_2]NJS16822.1 FHA domain-containing protein [Nostocaceae cyanobacterium CSU_2_110]